MTTINYNAKFLGTSVYTVHYALSKTCKISKKTKDKVLVNTNHQIAYDASLVYNANTFTEFKDRETLEKVLTNLKKLPFEGLICCNDELAIGALEATKAKGFESPRDFLISDFDNIDKTNFITPTLTTVHVDWFDYGKRMARLALDILAEQNISKFFIINANIIERESTKKLYEK